MLAFWFLFSVLMGIAIGTGAKNKGLDQGTWSVYGFLIWPVALVHLMMTRPNTAAVEKQRITSGETRKCPYCAELIRAEAVKCRYCGSDLSQQPAASFRFHSLDRYASADTNAGVRPGFLIVFGAILAVIVLLLVTGVI